MSQQSGRFQDRTVNLLSEFSKAKTTRQTLLAKSGRDNQLGTYGKYNGGNEFGHGLGLTSVFPKYKKSTAIESTVKVRHREDGMVPVERPSSAMLPRRQSSPVSKSGPVVRPSDLLQFSVNKTSYRGRSDVRQTESEVRHRLRSAGSSGTDKVNASGMRMRGDAGGAREFQELYDTINHMRVKSKQGVQDALHKSSGNQEDDVIFADTGDDARVVYRTADAKAQDPDRLNLDKRGFIAVPIIENEPNLRLLNLQFNQISRVSNLRNLDALVFLDLYKNKIESMCNFESVPTLRVLMLGRNQIKKIENIDCLKKLDVLDLHSNLLTRMEGLVNLSSLRVLNLAGNSISAIEDVYALQNLSELNLRRNQISDVTNVKDVPNLQHLFLADNRLQDGKSIENIFKLDNLTELSLEGNKDLVDSLGTSKEAYRVAIFKRLNTLVSLDSVKRTEADKTAHIQEDTRRSSGKAASSKKNGVVDDEVRHATLASIHEQWKRKNFATSKTRAEVTTSTEGGSSTEKDSSKLVQCELRKWSSVKKKLMDKKYMISIETDFIKQRLSAQSDLVDNGFYELVNEGGGAGETRTLKIYANGFPSLETQKITSGVEHIVIEYAASEPIIMAGFAKISKLKHVKSITLSNNQIKTLPDLYEIAKNLPPHIVSLRFKFNPVTRLELYRPWLVFHLQHVETLDEVAISESERTASSALFSKVLRCPFSRKKLSISSTQNELLERQQFMKHTHQAAEASRKILKAAVEAAREDKALDRQFHTIMHTSILEAEKDLERGVKHWENALNKFK
uniref:Uncharacterized protein n=1 Tax=Mucochytrium quahogii TaxID=96639 RepID=A0A7S2RVD0_9STRA|mmetsp:Transcript_18234/g.31061  ORF Transcript_18234/g.31061 Transcript_18234/m.31061 type:complete len:792 (+) Transcript_18234:383-2758(+)|eukprot:CAMPEP_0203753890 /NCGR_PEP_ID=MMETSP0098-20131031/7589_1 /ASSEMBLY_ACC=CAM_ASM_000208 /TAXON_ID=96639 /ORGANISM=" , Strain NY0313808BC1" /LENGTH=791 /DNA_ID=CAMNT_0050644693 /DNA_START=231 /DNA_END=2606 /DNA_ORIENTATION=-